jgi:hypothetical protein
MDFRKKLLVLTVSAMSFAGIAYGDACGTATLVSAPPNLLRLEGTAELVTDETIGCTGDTLTATTGQFIANLSLPVTSKQVSATLNEATLIITTTAGGAVATYPGTVSGDTVTFGTSALPVTFPTTAYTIRVANVRVNASTGAVGTYVTESLLATNQGVVIFAEVPDNVGYIEQGFAVPSLATGSVHNYAICQGNPATGTPGTSFGIKISELFGGAFKTITPTVAGNCGANPTADPPVVGTTCTETNGEAGSYNPTTTPAAPAGVGTANSGTEFLLTFANIPTGVTVYLPLTATNGTLTFTLVSSTTNPTPVAASIPTGSGLPAASAPVTSANGTGTAVYEVTATDNTVLGENATITGYVTAAAGFSTVATSPITVTVTPAPTGSINPTLVIPNFAASANPALTLSAFSVCQTSLLFPFVTNQLGFDTGLVLANTSTDPFTGVSNAVATPGTCALSFYGAGAPTPSTGVAAPGGTQASGTTNAFQLSSVAPGFQGYVIAVCNYLYGHGYAFIEYDLTQANGVAEGYLALVLGSARGQSPAETLTN